MRTSCIKNGLVVGVILLFIIVAVQPSIATVQLEKIDVEYVEITTEICGLAGKNHTVQLTKEEAVKIEVLFDSIRERLNNTETREEAEKIFKEAVVELDKYGLLGGLSVKQAQRLVTGGYQSSRFMKALEKLYGKNKESLDNYENSLCLIAGKTTTTMVIGPSTIFRVLLMLPLYLMSCFTVIGCEYLKLLGLARLSDFLFYVGSFVYLFFYASGFPFAELGGFIIFGYEYELPMFHWNYYPAKGWLWTLGSSGIRNWIGEFYGQLYNSYIGVSGFTGLRIGGSIFSLIGGVDTYYLGSALRVKIGDEHP